MLIVTGGNDGQVDLDSTEVLDFNHGSWRSLQRLSVIFKPARAGPKGLRAESARAFTGRQNSHSGRGEEFLTGQLNFFTETAVTPERKVEKWFPRWEINRHAEG